MKTTADLVKGWVSKADSDLENAQLCIAANASLDTACFHTQQAAEKFIKAYLMAYSLSVPFIHNLEKLLELCEQQDARPEAELRREAPDHGRHRGGRVHPPRDQEAHGPLSHCHSKPKPPAAVIDSGGRFLFRTGRMKINTNFA
jgi:HEPN domain-containing protein